MEARKFEVTFLTKGNRAYDPETNKLASGLAKFQVKKTVKAEDIEEAIKKARKKLKNSPNEWEVISVK